MSFSVARGNFDALNLPTWDREMIESAFKAVNSVPGAWDFLSTYEPGDGGFMFSRPPPKMEEINDAVNTFYGGHSGASYGCTMRVIQYIAKQGWDTWAQEALDKYGPPPPTLSPEPKKALVETLTDFNNFLDAISPSTKDCKPDPTLTAEQKREKFLALPTDMSLDEQAKAMRELRDVPMSYMEMRMRFG